MKIFSLLTLVIFALEPVAVVASECQKKYHVSNSINVSMTSVEKSYDAARAKYIDQAKIIEDVAKKNGMKKLELQSSSINISPQNSYSASREYNLNLYYNYTSEDSEELMFKLIRELESKDIQTNFNSNKSIITNNPGCNQREILD